MQSNTKEQLQQDSSIVELCSDVVTTLQRTINVCYSELPSSFTEEESKFLREQGDSAIWTFMKIDEAYTQLGLDQPVIYTDLINNPPKYLGDEYRRYQKGKDFLEAYTDLREGYVKYHIRGVLPEYLQVGPMSLLRNDHSGIFIDSNSDAPRLWADQIITLLKSTGGKRQLGQEAATALIDGLKTTSDFIEGSPLKESEGHTFAIALQHELEEALANSIDDPTAPESLT